MIHCNADQYTGCRQQHLQVHCCLAVPAACQQSCWLPNLASKHLGQVSYVRLKQLCMLAGMLGACRGPGDTCNVTSRE
jgi:hypothetical protein